MVNKISTFLKVTLITLLGALLFACFPIQSYAQYNNYYPYNYYDYPYGYVPLNITTTDATSITSSSATLNGQVNGNNLYSTYGVETWFQYGLNANLENSTVHTPANTGYVNFTSKISNLKPNTTYYFRAVGKNTGGVVYGRTNLFQTDVEIVLSTENNTKSNTKNKIKSNTGRNTAVSIAAVTTNPATLILSESAEINSLITNSPNNPSMTWFEWGTTSRLGNMTPIMSLGTLTSVKHINTITELLPNTTYYFRAVMQNAFSKINGATLSFTTNSIVNPGSNITTPEKNTTSATTTNTSATQSANPYFGINLGASVIGFDFFPPKNVFGWVILIILALILLLITKHLYRALLNKKPKNQQEHI